MNPTNVRGLQLSDLQKAGVLRMKGMGRGLRDIFYKPRGELEIIATHVGSGEKKVLVDGANLVVNLARRDMSRLIAGAYTDLLPATTLAELKARCVTKMSWGSGGHYPSNPTIPIPPTSNDSALAIEIGVVGKKSVTYDFPASMIVRFESSLGESEANGYGISEAGLWTNDNPDSPGNPILFARKTFGLITKTSDFIITFRWKIIF